MKAVFGVSIIMAFGIAIYLLRPTERAREADRMNAGTQKATESRVPVASPPTAPSEHKSDTQRSTLPERRSRPSDEDRKPIADLLSGEIIGVERLRNVGNRTASEAIESWLWAATQAGESEARALTRKAPHQFERQWEELISNAVREASAMKSIRVRRHESYGPDRMLVWIEPDSSGRSEVFLMTRTGVDGAWQRDLDPRAFK